MIVALVYGVAYLLWYSFFGIVFAMIFAFFGVTMHWYAIALGYFIADITIAMLR